MTIQDALTELGAEAELLTDGEKTALDRDGFLLLRGVLSAEQVEALRQREAELLTAEGDEAAKEFQQEGGTDRLSNLINKGREYHVVLTQPRVLAAIAYVLEGDVKLSSLNSRSAKHGLGSQPLHADWHEAVAPGDYQVCNSLWLLDDFLPDNGATRLVPGSHLSGQRPSDMITDPMAAHPDEVLLLAQAGDVAVVNSHTWHGGTTNVSGASRRVLHGLFVRRSLPTQLDQQKYFTAETQAQLSEAAQVVLGVSSAN